MAAAVSAIGAGDRKAPSRLNKAINGRIPRLSAKIGRLKARKNGPLRQAGRGNRPTVRRSGAYPLGSPDV